MVPTPSLTLGVSVCALFPAVCPSLPHKTGPILAHTMALSPLSPWSHPVTTLSKNLRGLCFQNKVPKEFRPNLPFPI